MTENEAIILLCQMYLPQFDEEERYALTMAIQVLEEIQQYRAMEEKLNGISVEQVVNGFINTVEDRTEEPYERGRILTNEEADMWNEYLAIGTLGEIRSIVKDYFTESERLAKYERIGTIEEFKALKEKNEPKKTNSFSGCIHNNTEQDWDFAK